MTSNNYLRVLAHLSYRRKLQLCGLVGLMLIAAAAELISLGALLPFLSVMAEPSKAFDYPILSPMIKALGLSKPDDLLLPFAVSFSVAVLVAAAIRLSLTWSSSRLTYSIGHDMGCKLYETTLYRPYRYHIAHNSSEILGGLNKVDLIIAQSLLPVIQLFSSLIISIFIITALLLANVSVALVAAFCFGGIYVAISLFLKQRLKDGGQRISSSQNRRIRIIQEGLGGIRDVLIDNSQREFVTHFERIDMKMRDAQASANFLAQAPKYLIEAIGMALIAGLTYQMSQSGGLAEALPTLGILALGAQKLMPLFQQIYVGWSRIQNSKVALNDILDLIEIRVGDMRNEGLVRPLNFENEIVLKDVFFRYGEDNRYVLNGLNLKILKGSQVGFIGSTGSGKSTTLDLIMGLLDPTKGSVVVDGVSIHSSQRRAWQSRIAHVPQSIYLSDASVAENIAFGIERGKIDMDRVRSAASRAQISDFIESSPLQYEMLVGERGTSLSGGQRQRIGIARAIYKHADVLILDEATSALDGDTEAAVMSALESGTEQMTILMISHRLSTIKNCDVIVEMDAGEIKFRGKYAERFPNGPDLIEMRSAELE